MSMQKPLDIDQLEATKKHRKAFQAKHTVGVVAPNGVISEHYCPPPDDGGDEGPKKGDILLRWVNGAPQVTRRYANKGFVLYSDLAAADGQPEKYQRWKTAIEARIMGLPLKGSADNLYSKSVLERRDRFQSGSVESGGKAFDMDSGEVVDDSEAFRQKLAARLKEVGAGDPDAAPKKTAKSGGKASS